ncbi:scavenger receptor class B member 1-like [Thrips palmi]|uniref:Scavenger receptor class B member 1-like n=1 Tax=Thrips palmi TaxID=161013 RepID=A0A6P8YCZ7_THRPL|nr:scavenger receptor class B member 1-like [Thrips palmi]
MTRLVIDVGCSSSASSASSDVVSSDGLSSAGDCRSLARDARDARRRPGPGASACIGSADKVTWALLLAGCLCLFLGVVTTVFTPYDMLMRERLKMQPGLPAFEWWATPPDEVLLRVYVFNVTNQHDFESGRTNKLHMQEVGPFIFREKLAHTNATFHENGTMTYTAVRTAIFLPEMNTLSLNDTITVPNLAVLGMASYLHDASFLTKMGFSLILQRLDSQPLMNISVYDYMWNLTDPLVHVTRRLVPHLVPVENMGILSRIYDDFTDEVSVFIGPENEYRFFQMDRFHGNRNLGWWSADRCDSVYGGTEGVSYHQGVHKDHELRYFRKTLCRVTPLYYAREEHRLGMSAMRFELPDDVYDRPENATSETDCFTRPGKEPLPAGLTDLAPCYFDFPIAASMPHFYSSPHLHELVGGMQPNRSKHHSYVIVEPTTGVPMNAAARSQSNLIVHDVSGITKVARFSNQVIPMFWAEYNQVGLPWYIQATMYFTVMILPWSQRLCTAAMMLAGLLMVALAVRRWSRSYRAARKRLLRRGLRAVHSSKAPPLSSYSSLDLLPASSSGSSTGASPSTASSAASTSGSTAETPLSSSKSSSTEQVAALS